MPFNLTRGNSALFVVEFLDNNGNLTVPSSGTLTISYTNTSNASQIDSVALAAVNSFFRGTWSSVSAALGLATWNVSAPGISNPAQSGQIRLISS